MATRLLPLLLITGCAQTATVLDPSTMFCSAKCVPNQGCVVEFSGTQEKNIEESELLYIDVISGHDDDELPSPAEQ